MKLLKELNHFWNVTLGADYPDEVNIEGDSAEMQELQESLKRLENMENKVNSTSSKSGKGGKGSQVVEKVKADEQKAIEELDIKASQKPKEDKERV